LLALKPDVLKISGVPQRIEVTFDGALVVNVAGAGINTRSHGVGGYSTVSVDHNFGDDILLRRARTNQKKTQQEAKPGSPSVLAKLCK
jgi:hypothetical protein